MPKAFYRKHTLQFKVPGGTSRGVLKVKETFFLFLEDDRKWGVGECGLLRGLSVDDSPSYEEKLRWVCDNIALGEQELYDSLIEFPSIQFGVETAFGSLAAQDPFQLFPSEFSRGNAAIPINGLIWMGDRSFMKKQIAEKLQQGFSCLKMKIGAIDFQTEIELLRSIRKQFTASEIEIRVDANGAFAPSEALEKLKILSDLELHSIEQPIKPGQMHEMAALCEASPLAVALDEELIGVFAKEKKRNLIATVNPQYIILKPSLIGGFKGSDSWMEVAETNGTQWWITSALESNIGLNAISQYTFTKNSKLPQGLGTGSLYSNNIPSPLEVKDGSLFYDPQKQWKFNL
jgi:o-succinylbenzoate synthase